MQNAFGSKANFRRAEALLSPYESRAQKWIRIPFWSEQELSELGYGLQRQIRRALMLRAIYIAKLSNLQLTALGYEVVPIPVLNEWTPDSAALMPKLATNYAGT